MSDIKLAIIGGGLAGLSAGCYARANGFDVTILSTTWRWRRVPPGTAGPTP